MNNLEFTLLEKYQILGNNRLSIFDKYGTKAAITDFAILLGGAVSSDYHTGETNDLKDRTGAYHSKTKYTVYNKTSGVSETGYVGWCDSLNRKLGALIVLPYASILNFSSNEFVEHQRNIIEFGEYPQTIVDEDLSNELERLLMINKLYKTKKEYSTDSVNYDNYDSPFKERKHIEYVYNGEKYIRILGDYNSKGETLSDGRVVVEGKPYWVKVEPIEWLVDKERNVAVSKKLLFSGVQFDNKENYNGDFYGTNMYNFLKNYFSKDVVPSKIERPKLYLVNFSGEEKKYFPAYEKDDILRELYTNIELVPEEANFYPENALKYLSKISATTKEYYPYILNKIKIDTKEYLEYLFELCVLGDNEEIYSSYEKTFIEKQVYDFVNEQAMKLVIR